MRGIAIAATAEASPARAADRRRYRPVVFASLGRSREVLFYAPLDSSSRCYVAGSPGSLPDLCSTSSRMPSYAHAPGAKALQHPRIPRKG